MFKHFKFQKVYLYFFNPNPVNLINQVKNLFQDSAETSPRRKDGKELSKDSVVDPEYFNPNPGFLLKFKFIHILGQKTAIFVVLRRSPEGLPSSRVRSFSRSSSHPTLLNLGFHIFLFFVGHFFGLGPPQHCKTYIFGSFFLWDIFSFSGHHNTAKTYIFSSFLWRAIVSFSGHHNTTKTYIFSSFLWASFSFSGHHNTTKNTQFLGYFCIYFLILFWRLPALPEKDRNPEICHLSSSRAREGGEQISAILNFSHEQTRGC